MKNSLAKSSTWGKLSLASNDDLQWKEKVKKSITEKGSDNQ
jgi:hypothetical protein